MKKTLKVVLPVLLIMFLSVSEISAQNLKLEELNLSLTAKNYPERLFETLENKGFYRVDKQYLPYCDRVVYAFVKTDRPSMFVNPVICPKPQTSNVYPIRVKNEIELQFQKNGRALFDAYHSQIKKTCKVLATENAMETEAKTKSNRRVYRHETTGITYVVLDTAPAAFIYLLK